MNEETCSKTCLYDRHTELGARIVPFGGFLMPLQYEGIVAEHQAVRERCGLFDTCHMGEIKVAGDNALEDLERLLTCEVVSIKDNRCRYGLMCNPEGGVLDDLLVYRKPGNEFMLVVNSATQSRDYEWIRSHVSERTSVDNASDRIAKIDVQGPESPRIVQQLLDNSIEGMKFYSFADNSFEGEGVLISRTGYTGEMGFEVYFESNDEAAGAFWKKCMGLGSVPCGLGARDTLRLEMGMPLYGHEMSEDRNAGETGFKRPISREKSFIGSDVVLDESACMAKMVGIMLEGRRAAREGDDILDQEGSQIGKITSGSYAPSIGQAVALGYVEKGCSDLGRGLIVNTLRRPTSGTIHSLPFYAEGTARRKLADFLERK